MPDPPEPDLDLVGDRDGPGGSGRSYAPARNPGGGTTWPADPGRRFGDDRPDRATGTRGRVEDRPEVRGVRGSGRRRGPAVPAAIRIRQRCDVDMLRPAAAARTVELVRADVDEAAGVAVVRALEDDHVAATGRGPRQPEGQLVGLAPRVDEVGDLQRRREGGDQALGVVEHRRVEVSGVRLQQRLLPGRGLDDARMGVTDVGDVVDEVEVCAAVGVVEVRALARARSSAATGS